MIANSAPRIARLKALTSLEGEGLKEFRDQYNRLSEKDKGDLRVWMEEQEASQQSNS